MLQHNWELSAHGLGRNCLLDFLNMAKKELLDRYVAGGQPVESTFQISRYLVVSNKLRNF